LYSKEDKKILKKILKYLPKKDIDILNLYFYNNINQNTIGKIFYISQGDVSFKLKRVIKRLQFLKDFPIFEGRTKDLMQKDLIQILTKNPEEDANIMMSIYEFTSQTRVSKILNINQSKCRYRFYRSIKRLEEVVIENDELIKERKIDNQKKIKQCIRYANYLIAFKMIKSNYNILRHLNPQKRWQEKEKRAKKAKSKNKNKMYIDIIN